MNPMTINQISGKFRQRSRGAARKELTHNPDA